jgi:type VI secretion system secreted protein Hcp
MKRIWKNLCVLLLVGTLIIAGTKFAASSDTQIDTNNLVDSQTNPIGTVNNQLGTLTSVNAYLMIDGILGESNDKDHKDWIDIKSYSWGETNAVVVGAGGGAGKVSMQDFKFVMKVNKASPKLFLAVANGKHIKNAVLEVCRNSETQQCFMKWTLNDVIVTSYQTIGGTSEGDIEEQFSLNFGMIEIEYKPIKPDGSVGESIKAKWDLKTNKGG